MAISRDEVRHVAMLFRMALSEEEIAKFQQQLSQIIDYFQVLQQVDTEGVPPTSHPLQLENVMRDDEPQPSYPREAILANAPLSEAGFFRVRAVLE
ncbi:MAG: Asp-tRNA(Asn)/Glu-tRNA(Gln) amidotransferase subunit GatC [Dehalococcoidia bacterium]